MYHRFSLCKICHFAQRSLSQVFLKNSGRQSFPKCRSKPETDCLNATSNMSLKKHSRLDLLLYCLYIIKSTNQHTADNAVKCAHCASQIHPDIFFFECLCVSAGSHCKHKWLIQMWVQAAQALSDAPLSGLRQNQGGVNSV